jgi:formyl-CoA transferase
MNAPYQAIRCADGYITVGAANDRTFQGLCDALEHPEWAREADFSDNASRVTHRAALAARIESVMACEPRDHWLARLETHGVPCGPINTYADVMADPHIQARDLVVDTDHPTLGRIKTLGTPVKLSDTPLTPGRPAPMLGQHTDEVLREIGFTIEDIAKLRGS